MNRQKSFQNASPTLYLVATPIGNLDEMTPRAVEILKNVDIIAAEDTRTSQKLLQHFNITTHCIAHHLHNENESKNGLLKLLEEGKNIALISDAGYPLISDPGQALVELVIANGFNVVPVSGSNAALAALVASGINAQPYTFIGFLSEKEKERNKTLIDLKAHPYTLIFYEAPHRIQKTLESMLDIFGNRKICLARELTKRYEEFFRGNIQEIIDECYEIKGEIVIVVEPEIREKDIIPTEVLKKQIEKLINEGLSAKDAIKQVAKENGISKNSLYNEYHEIN